MDEIPHIRTSERRSFKRCQMQWWWSYREGLTLRSTRPDARWFGTGIHLAMAERYKYRGMRRGADVLKVWRDYVGDEVAFIREAGDVKDEDQWVGALELGEAMLGGYLERYGKDERWYVISSEQTFEVPIPTVPTSKGFGKNLTEEQRTLVYYNGTFDGVRLDQSNADSLWLWEYKTAATIRTSHLSLDDQAGSYWALAVDVMRTKGLKFNGKLEGIMYDFLRKAKPTDDDKLDADGVKRNKPTKAHYLDALHNKVIGLEKMSLAVLAESAATLRITVQGDVSKIQPTPLFLREEVWRTRAERRTQLQRIQNEALQMNAVRYGNLPVIKNPTMECSWCDFFNMCELDEQNADIEEFKEAAYTVRDPYLAHRFDGGTD